MTTFSKSMRTLLAAMLLASCAAELKTTNETETEESDEEEIITALGGPNIKISNNGDETLQVVVDAHDEAVWIYLDLDTLTQVFPAAASDISVAAAEDGVWDLAFQRFKIGSNGGASGKAGVKIAALEGEDFLGLAAAPADATFREDATDSSDEDNHPDLVFLKFPAGGNNDGWYDYDSDTHVLTPRDVVYVPVSTLGNPYKIKLTNYYNSAGTSGYVTFDLAGMFEGWSADGVTTTTDEADDGDGDGDGDDDDNTPAPKVAFTANGDGTYTVKVNSSDHTEWIYVDFDTRAQVTPATPTNSTAWDLAFRRSEIKVNNGVSGSGDVDVAALEGANFAALSAAPARYGTPYYVDGDKERDGTHENAFTTYPVSGGGGWYSYNVTTHKIAARDVVYVFRSRSGAYHKVKLENYYDGTGASGYLTLQLGGVSAPADDADGCYNTGPYAKSTVLPQAYGSSVTVDASDNTSWTYFDLESGLQMFPCDATNSTIWDVAFQRTGIKLNGGANGAAGVELAAIKGDDFDLRAAAPAVTYATDAAVTTLAFKTYPAADVANDFGWYHYAGSPTHLITARDVVYAVRSAQGNYFKLKISDYYKVGTSTAGWLQFKYGEITAP